MLLKATEVTVWVYAFNLQPCASTSSAGLATSDQTTDEPRRMSRKWNDRSDLRLLQPYCQGSTVIATEDMPIS
jgi:hypothetical protein